MSSTVKPKNIMGGFGVLVDKLSISQRDIFINVELNKMVNKYYEISPIVFFQDYAKTVQTPLFARLQIKDMFCYKNPVIANDIKTALLLQKTICPPRKLLYMWDLEWIYNKKYPFDVYRDIYFDFEIIVRNDSHRSKFSKTWREPDFIVEDFNYEQIRNVIVG